MRRYLACFAATVSGIAVLLALLALGFGTWERLDGDLTRIGFYAERDFGWNAPQPVFRIQENPSQADRADILVLGDSFSIRNVWQSALSAGLHRQTASFRYEADDCFDGFVDLAMRHRRARIIIVESVERNFVSRFGEDRPCASGQPAPLTGTAGLTSGERAIWPPELHVKQTVLGAFNAVKMRMHPDAALKGVVVNAPLTPGCGRFSSQRADRILYYGDDEKKSAWTAQSQGRAVARLARLHREFAAHGKAMVFVLVPDKSSVYRDCLPADERTATSNPFGLLQALRHAGVDAVDLLPAFQASAKETVDFYYPNNTHLSERGYLAMAAQLQRHLSKDQAPSPR